MNLSLTPLVKVGIVAGTSTSLAIAGYVGGICSAPNLKISKLIEEEYTHLLLNTEDNIDDSYWATNWKNYKAQKENVFGLEGWKNSDNSLNLKKKCASLKDYFVYSKEDELYKNVTSYCTRYVTVEDEAKREGLRILDTKGQETESVWSQKASHKPQLQDDIKKLEIDYPSANAEKIKKGCDDSKTKSKQLEDFFAIYNSYVTICTMGSAKF